MPKIDPVAFAAQQRAAFAFMQAYEEYARSIGCEVYQDAIVSNMEQAEKLSAWWRDHAKNKDS